MPVIQVRRRKADNPYEFEVSVREGSTQTLHRVTMSVTTCRRLSGEKTSPERVIEAAFRFLLDREPKESILRTFDVTDISTYFADFEKKIGRYL
jgi:hypothetical protein